ncbi:MAG: hypothetical protein ACQES9_08465 [Myxococcota bacterium]
MLKNIKKFAAGTLSLGTTVLMAACYGPTHPSTRPFDNIRVRGELKGEATGISGLQVCIHYAGTSKFCKPTKNGVFQLEVPQSIHSNSANNNYSICVENSGQFQTSCKQIPPHKVPPYLFIEVNSK